MELTPRGALSRQITLIVRAVLHAVDHAQSLTEARRILAAVWAGVLDADRSVVRSRQKHPMRSGERPTNQKLVVQNGRHYPS
jgi:hypothetical protein